MHTHQLTLGQDIKKRILIYSVETPWSPCARVRMFRPFTHLSTEWEIIWGYHNGAFVVDALYDTDLVILHRFTPALMPALLLEKILASGKPVIYESDDLLNDIPDDHPEAAEGKNWKEGIEYAIRHAYAIVVSTDSLAIQYRVHVLRNHINHDLFFPFIPDDETYANKLQFLVWDIAPPPPARENKYNEYKTYIKWPDYSSCGIASVFSDVAVYDEVVTHDATGYFIPGDHDIWLSTIIELIVSQQKRFDITTAAQKELWTKHPLHHNAWRYDDLHDSLINANISSGKLPSIREHHG